jgi:hypothetical protein
VTGGTTPAEQEWLEVPCGHPSAPVAFDVPDGWVCHCGRLLNDAPVLSDGGNEDAPGPIVPCDKCGCHVAIPLEEPKP